MAEIVRRQVYLDLINHCLGKEAIIVLTGQRRVGKSYLLRQLREDACLEDGANVIYIDKEKHEFDAIGDYRQLNAYIASRWKAGRHNYVLIDEAQDIAGFERSVRSWRTEPHTEVVITGSNARMLSGELSTLLGGRYREIYVYPLSYNEFLTFHDLVDGDEALSLYLQYGGMPGLRRVGLDGDDARQYLTDIYHTILLKDVILRNQIRNTAFLENLVAFLADSSGKAISANSISRYMKSEGQSVTSTAVINYLRYLTDAFIVRRVGRYDIHGKRLLGTLDRYYFEDCGLRNAIVGGSREGDVEKVLEGVVCQHLLRSGWQVHVGQLHNAEIDFVCSDVAGRRAYVQVTYLMVDPQTRDRELGNLHRIGDQYPKYVVSMTPLLTRSDADGITHLGLRTFLSTPFRV